MTNTARFTKNCKGGYMFRRILVTGGAGFIGSHIVDALIQRGYKVRVLDNLNPQVHGARKNLPDCFNQKAEFIWGNVKNRYVLENALRGVDAVFHEAAEIGVGQSMYRIVRYVNVNTVGTAKLLQILAEGKLRVKKLIVASSMSVYGEGNYKCKKCSFVYPKLRDISQLKKHLWEMRCPKCQGVALPVPTDEEKPLLPSSIYAITKRDQEEMCLNIGKAYNIPTVVLRYFNVYGPRQALSNPYTGVAAIFSTRILNSNSPVVFEDGLQSRDFIHVSDIVQANILALENEDADYQIFNVGTGKKLTILDLACTLIEKLNPDIRLTIVNKFREGDIRHCFADISKIEKKLGFKSKVDFETGIEDLINWVRAQLARDKAPKAIMELKQRGLIK